MLCAGTTIEETGSWRLSFFYIDSHDAAVLVDRGLRLNGSSLLPVQVDLVKGWF